MTIVAGRKNSKSHKKDGVSNSHSSSNTNGTNGPKCVMVDGSNLVEDSTI